MKGKGKNKRKQQMAYFAKLASGKNTASPEYWASKKARPNKQERRHEYKHEASSIRVGKHTECPECSHPDGYGKKIHIDRYYDDNWNQTSADKVKEKYCSNCAHGVQGRGWV